MDQPAIHRAPERLAARKPRRDLRPLAHQPAQFGGGEGRIQIEPGLCADFRAGLLHGLGIGLAAAALPDDGRMQRPAGRRVPDHQCFGLIADSGAGDLAGCDAALRQHIADAVQDIAKHRRRVLLDPARLRRACCDAALGDGPYPRLIIHQHDLGVRRALIDAEKELHAARHPSARRSDATQRAAWPYASDGSSAECRSRGNEGDDLPRRRSESTVPPG